MAAVLAERWPDLVWECTHVGGDRFAANILVVPDGVLRRWVEGRAPQDAAAIPPADRLRA